MLVFSDVITMPLEAAFAHPRAHSGEKWSRAQSRTRDDYAHHQPSRRLRPSPSRQASPSSTPSAVAVSSPKVTKSFPHTHTPPNLSLAPSSLHAFSHRRLPPSSRFASSPHHHHHPHPVTSPPAPLLPQFPVRATHTYHDRLTYRASRGSSRPSAWPTSKPSSSPASQPSASADPRRERHPQPTPHPQPEQPDAHPPSKPCAHSQPAYPGRT